MQQEHKKAMRGGTAAKIICWALTAACMAAIFYFSSRTADESEQQSGFFAQLITRLFGIGGFSDFIIRKLAHFTEFAGLGLLFAIALKVQTGKPKTPAAIICSSIYAATDEIHQIFVPGRACRVLDWGIDTCGAALGALAVLLIITLSAKNKAAKSKNQSNNKQAE